MTDLPPHQARQRAADDDARERFLVNIVHELRTPLALVDGPLQQLARAPDLEPYARELVRVARANCLRLMNVADDLLELARIGAQGEPGPGATALTAPVVLDDWLRGLLAAIAHHPALGALPLAEHLDAPGATVAAEAGLLERVVLNLVANAIKFSAGRGAIRIGSFADAHQAGFWVEDDGVGIAPEHHALIFERFRQVDDTLTRRHGGAGIGLALVRAWLIALGGTIEVDSALERGARFTVRLPRAGAAPARYVTSMRLHTESDSDAPAAFERVLRSPLAPALAGGSARTSAEPAAAVAPIAMAGRTEPAATVDLPDGGRAAHPLHGAGVAPRPAARVRVLVVEDEAELRWLLLEALRTRFDVLAAADGEAALALARLAVPDVLLTDWMLPGRDGLALTRALRADPAADGLRILMITARAGEDERVAALAAGVDDFVAKPFSMTELAARLSNLGRAAQSERALRAANRELAAANEALGAARERLVQDEKLKSIGVLAAGLIHEINNPVSYMRTATELLGREPAIGAHAPAAELVAAIAQGLDRVGTLVSDLRVFAWRGGAQSAAPAAQTVDLREVVARARRLTTQTLLGIDVRVELAAVWVMGAESQLVQVVVNLLTNAAAALAHGGRPDPVVWITLERAGASARLVVRDNGPGIAPEVRERLFEPFFTTGEVGQGLGLGLVMCQAIVRAHDGRIQVHSAPGPGASFVVDLPAAIDPDTDQGGSGVAPAPPG